MNGTRVKLDVALTIDSATVLSHTESAVAVIDVLRATSTVSKALHSKASSVFPVSGLEAAKEAAMTLAPALLCGERLGVRPEGFDLGNSPLEYGEDAVAGKKLVLATTNGTKALDRYSDARLLTAASLLNATAVAEYLLSTGRDMILVCAGQDGTFGAEDAICAGMMVERMIKEGVLMTDPAWMALTAYRACRHDLAGSIKKCDHAGYLIEEGFEQDVEYCSKADILNVVPVATVLEGRTAVVRA
ncbi:MAG TPA: 2-phosphosulfolactate phosphatase [Bacillota bacterium]|nr:MAG: putative 2-phosphosulfolactate phosphatase [Firmicutes bacterium ADurb.Bin153]HNV34789.1 2-phosphosulfolactate phosphatase [Bacillota bacterium]